MGTSITIQMERPTLAALNASGYSLLAFTAVQVSDTAAQPLVWLRTQQYMENTEVAYGTGFEAFTTEFPGQGNPVVPGFSTAIQAGETLWVNTSFGAGEVKEEGEADAVTIANQTSTPLGCGICQPVNGAFAPVCLLPLHGNNGQVIVPGAAILLLFSTAPAAEGTPVETASGPGVLLNVGVQPQPQVSYDIDRGWDWGEAAWGQAVPFGTPLGPLLTPVPAFLLDRGERLRTRLAALARRAGERLP